MSPDFVRVVIGATEDMIDALRKLDPAPDTPEATLLRDLETIMREWREGTLRRTEPARRAGPATRRRQVRARVRRGARLAD